MATDAAASVSHPAPMDVVDEEAAASVEGQSKGGATPLADRQLQELSKCLTNLAVGADAKTDLSERLKKLQRPASGEIPSRPTSGEVPLPFKADEDKPKEEPKPKLKAALPWCSCSTSTAETGSCSSKAQARLTSR